MFENMVDKWLACLLHIAVGKSANKLSGEKMTRNTLNVGLL